MPVVAGMHKFVLLRNKTLAVDCESWQIPWKDGEDAAGLTD